jgi:hypothetical protein
MATFKDFGAIPDISGSTTEISLRKIQDYLFVLREQMNYVLANLGVENINASSLSEMKMMFTEEIAAAITNAQNDVTALELTAQGLELSLTDANGNLSALAQDVEGLSLCVKDKDGNMSSVSLRNGVFDLKNLVFHVLSENGATVIDGGNITTGIIDAVDINGVNILGCTITGSDFLTSGEESQVKLNGGQLSVFSGGGILYGSLSYSEWGCVSFSSAAGSDMEIYADKDLMIDAKDGNTVAIGTAIGTEQEILIGNTDSMVEIKGDQIIFTGMVIINGTTLPY